MRGRTSVMAVIAVFATVLVGVGGATAEVPASRLAGESRYETAVAISGHAFPKGADVAYLARAEAPLVDALAGGVLTDGPVLLVPPCGDVPAAVTDEIDRLAPAEVVALGGPAAICDDVLNAVAAGRASSRLAGNDRYATAVVVGQAAFAGREPASVYLARAQDPLVDALAGGALTDGPILLVPPCGEPAPLVAAEIARIDPKRVMALGGTTAVCDDHLDAFAGDRTRGRLAGESRYQTAVAIAEEAFPDTADTVYVARGVDPLVDALAGGALTDGPVLLVPPTLPVPTEVLAAVARLAPNRVTALGGPAAIGDDVLAAVAAASDGHVDPEPEIGVNEVDPDVTLHRVDGDVSGLTTVDHDTVTLRLPARTAAVGDHLSADVTAATPSGLLVRVTDVRRDGAHDVVTAVHASLRDIIPSGDVGFEVDVATPDRRAADRPRRVEVSCGAEASVELTVDPPTLSYGIDMGAAWLPGEGGSAYFRAEGNFALGAEASVSGEVDCQFALPLPGPTLAPVRFVVGGVPVTLVPRISFNITGELEAETSATVHGDASAEVQVLASYDDGRFVGPNVFTDRTADAGVETTAEATLRLDATATVSLEAYDVAGPAVTIGPFAEGKLAPLDDPWLTVDAGVAASLDVIFDFAGIDERKTVAQYELFRTRIVEESGAYPGPRITTTSLPEGTIGQPYDVTIGVDGGTAPLTWSASSLPDGLELDGDGRLHGTVEETDGTVAVTVVDADGYQDSAAYRLDGSFAGGEFCGVVSEGGPDQERPSGYWPGPDGQHWTATYDIVDEDEQSVSRTSLVGHLPNGQERRRLFFEKAGELQVMALAHGDNGDVFVLVADNTAEHSSDDLSKVLRIAADGTLSCRNIGEPGDTALSSMVVGDDGRLHVIAGILPSYLLVVDPLSLRTVAREPVNRPYELWATDVGIVATTENFAQLRPYGEDTAFDDGYQAGDGSSDGGDTVSGVSPDASYWVLTSPFNIDGPHTGYQCLDARVMYGSPDGLVQRTRALPDFLSLEVDEDCHAHDLEALPDGTAVMQVVRTRGEDRLRHVELWWLDRELSVIRTRSFSPTLPSADGWDQGNDSYVDERLSDLIVDGDGNTVVAVTVPDHRCDHEQPTIDWVCSNVQLLGWSATGTSLFDVTVDNPSATPDLDSVRLDYMAGYGINRRLHVTNGGVLLPADVEDRWLKGGSSSTTSESHLVRVPVPVTERRG